MSTVNPLSPGDGTAAVVTDVPSTLTITHYKQLAEQFRKAFSEAIAMVPTADPSEFANAEASRRRLNVPLEFLRTAIASVERNPELQNVQKLNVLLGLDTLQYLEAFRPMLDELLAFVNRLTLTLQSRQATVSLEALHIYDVAKSVNRDERSPELSAAIANMKRDLGRRGRPAHPGRGPQGCAPGRRCRVRVRDRRGHVPQSTRGGKTVVVVAEPRPTAARP